MIAVHTMDGSEFFVTWRVSFRVDDSFVSFILHSIHLNRNGKLPPPVTVGGSSKKRTQ